MSLTADELAQACLGILAHDAGKASPAWQDWIRRGDDTRSPGQEDEQCIRDQVARFAERLGFEVRPEAVTAALRTLRSERTAAATAKQLFVVHGRGRWIVVADLVAAIDHACSANGLLDALDTLRRGYLGDKIRFDYHLVRARGMSTPFVHRAAEEAFEQAGWMVALRFAEGSLYVVGRASGCSAPLADALAASLEAALTQALAGGSAESHAELVVNRKAATQTVFPSPDLIDIERLREYLEVAGKRAGPEAFMRKKPEHQRKVLEKFFKLVDRDASALGSSDVLAREASRVSRAHPEMMILKAFRDATLVKQKEGKVFDPSRECFTDDDKPHLERFSQRSEKSYDELFGVGAHKELARTSTLQPYQDMRTVERFWSLPASRFDREVPGDRVELLPDKDRADLLIEQLSGIFERAISDLPTPPHLRHASSGQNSSTEDVATRISDGFPVQRRPRPLTPQGFAKAFSRDVLHPNQGNSAPEHAREQLEYYCSGKESTKTAGGRHLCPICNEAFGAGRPAKAAFLDKPEQHTNRAPAFGSDAPIVICDPCRLDRIFGKLVARFRPEITFVVYPRHNVGREVGRFHLERAREFMRLASEFMGDTTPDAAHKPSLSLTETIARNLGLRSPEGMPAVGLAEMLLFRNTEKKLQEYRKKLEDLMCEQGDTIEQWNAVFDTNYGDAETLLSAIEKGDIANELARQLRAEAFAIRASFAMVAQTPHAILLPSADPLKMKVGDSFEAEMNSGIRQVFVALLLALGLEAKVAILRDGVPPEPDLLEGIVAIPENAALRRLFRGPWIDLVDTGEGRARRPGAITWLRAIAAASQLGGIEVNKTYAFPQRSAYYSILTAATPGHLVRRIEEATKQAVRRDHLEWIEAVAEVLPEYDAAAYEAACRKE